MHEVQLSNSKSNKLTWINKSWFFSVLAPDLKCNCSFTLIILTLWFYPLFFTCHCNFAFGLCIFAPLFDCWLWVKSYWLVNSKGPNHKVKNEGKITITLQNRSVSSNYHDIYSSLSILSPIHSCRSSLLVKTVLVERTWYSKVWHAGSQS